MEAENNPPAPKLARRKMNRKSSIKTGRTIGEKRERLETANERAAARKKDKLKTNLRIIFTIIGFLVVICLVIGLIFSFRHAKNELEDLNSAEAQVVTPKIEIVDEDASATGGHLTTRMVEYINQVSSELTRLGYQPIKAVIPSGKIREVDFYLKDLPGYVKTTVDRGAGVTAEDAERMIRYLNDNGIKEFSYIDVRVDRKAYWK